MNLLSRLLWLWVTAVVDIFLDQAVRTLVGERHDWICTRVQTVLGRAGFIELGWGPSLELPVIASVSRSPFGRLQRQQFWPNIHS